MGRSAAVFRLNAAARTIIGRYYPDRTIVGIDCRNLVYYGGVLHCVTQQQPK